MKRTKVVDALKSTDYGKDIVVKGWARSHRSSKAVDFIALNDGSTIKNLQVVVDPSAVDAEELKSITTGACIGVEGTLVESQGKGQTVEVQAKKIVIYGLEEVKITAELEDWKEGGSTVLDPDLM